MRLLSNTPTPEQFKGVNSDLGFFGKYAIQGTFNGWLIWDVSNPGTSRRCARATSAPRRRMTFPSTRTCCSCRPSRSRSRLDCKEGGIKDPVSAERIRGIRIFDISDLDNPKYVASVQTCRGSHTHTLVVDPKDPNNVYIYVSGSSGIRPAAELAGCSSNSRTIPIQRISASK